MEWKVDNPKGFGNVTDRLDLFAPLAISGAERRRL